MTNDKDDSKHARFTSFLAAAACWVALTALSGFFLWVARDRARLIRDNDNEHLLFTLFAQARNYSDYGQVIEQTPLLAGRVTGLGLYGEDLAALYAYGNAPDSIDGGVGGTERGVGGTERGVGGTERGSAVFTPPVPDTTASASAARRQNGRRVIESAGNVRFVFHWEKPTPRQDGQQPPHRQPPRQSGLPTPPPPYGSSLPPAVQPKPALPPTVQERPSLPPFWGASADESVRYFLIEITDGGYYRVRLATIYALPLAALAFLGLALYVRALYLKNREYRIRIAVQKNLVVLGTAASTLAHEIKNPLLSIRLQTGILRKLHESDPPEELAVIDEEINRLSSLTFKINDYLRDAAGRSGPLDVGALVAETSLRLCGVNILTNRDTIPACRAAAILVEMDEDRARSVIENILTNALESGSPTSLIQAIITRTGGSSFAPGRGTGMVRIDIADRGCGLCGTDPGILFDPFYTSKSRGTGIGLAVCKRFVEAAGGAIAAASREGGGVIVSVTLKEYADTDR